MFSIVGRVEAMPIGYNEPMKFYLGLNIGPVLGWDEDINGRNAKSTLGFNIGGQVLNSPLCRNCQNIMMETSFDYERLGRFSFGPTQFRNSRTMGDFKESISVIHGNCGVRYYFAKSKKISPFISLTPGVYYIKVGSVSFNDFNGNDLDTGGLNSSHINFGFGVGIGLSCQLSYKLMLEFYPKWHVYFPLGPNNSLIQFPLTLKYRF